MVFVKVVFAGNATPGAPEREKGMRLDENAAVKTLYKGAAEKFEMLLDYDRFKFFTLGQSGTADRNKIIRALSDEDILADCSEVHPSCRILYIDEALGLARMKQQDEQNMLMQLKEVEPDGNWGMGRVYLAELFYTKQAAGPAGTARVLTDGKGLLPSVEIRGISPSAFSTGLKARLFDPLADREVEKVLASRGDMEVYASEVSAIRNAADLLTFKMGLFGLGGSLGQFLGHFYEDNVVVLELQAGCLVLCVRDAGATACDANWSDAQALHQSLADKYSSSVESSQLTDVFVHYGLIPKPEPKEEAKPEPVAVPEPVQEEPVVEPFKIQVDPADLVVRTVPTVAPRSVDPVVSEVVTDTVSDMVDMVELMNESEADLLWAEAESAADAKLAADEARFQDTLEQLFKAHKVEVAETDMQLEDHVNPERLMLADFTAEENTPFTQPIRQLVERFGQTILMVEDLEESIASLEDLKQGVDALQAVAPPKKPAAKVHHSNLAATGPTLDDAEKDLPRSPPPSQPLKNKSVLASRKSQRLPKVMKPTETLPIERSYPISEKGRKKGHSVTVNLNGLMKASESQLAIAQDDQQEANILLRLYEYLHDKVSTVKNVFMEFDRDGSGSIDHQELYYALRHLGFEIQLDECGVIVNAIEKRSAELEHKFHNDHKAYHAHMRAEEKVVGTLGVNTGGYMKHVDGKVDYKELMSVVTDAARKKGLLGASSRFTATGQLKKRAPGSSILKGAKGASKIKGVRGIQGLNSMYRTHARISGEPEAAEFINVAHLDVIGPILPVESLGPEEYGLISADNLIYPVKAEAAAECEGLLTSQNRCVQIDALGAPTVQAIAELLEGLTYDDTQLHKNTLRRLDGELLTLLVAACELENLRLFIATVDKVLEEGQQSVVAIEELITESFAHDLPALSWHKLGTHLTGVSPAMDIFWFTRCREEFKAEDEFESCEGMWKQIYCELRFQRHLRGGLESVTEQELALWDNFIGPMVQTVDLSETACRDDTVAVCVAYCTNVKYLDLHESKVTDRAVDELVSHIQDLVWINIEETAITGEGVEKLVQAFPKLELVC